nr:hypothetical protein [Kineococcus aurantiacus]
MRDVGTWVAVLGSLGGALVPLRGPRGRRWVSLLVPVLAVVAGFLLNSLDGGPRWQLLPLLVAAVLAVARFVAGRRRVRFPAAAAAVVATFAGTLAVWAFPPLRVPGPTGPHPVGTTEVSWDGPVPDCPASTVVAQVWYPAATAGEPAPHLGRDRAESRQVAAALAGTFGVPGFLLREAVVARSPAADGTPVAAGRFPVVLFSPGDASVRRQNSAWATALAAGGRVVVALDHPCDSALVVEPDGDTVPTRVRSTGDDARDQAAADRQVGVRARQLSSALDELTRRNAADGLLRGHLDLSRVAATGHSLGGAAALRVAADDDRVDAAVDLDGLPRGADGLDVPVLFLVAGRGTGNPDADAAYARAVEAVAARSPAARVQRVPGAAHLTFTDAPLFLPPVPSVVGSLGREESVAVTVRATEEFLGEFLDPR